MFFIGTNPHNVRDGNIVDRHHVKARSGWRKNGQVGSTPGGMYNGRTVPGMRVEYIEPYHYPEEWWLKLRRSDGRKGWVQVDRSTYLLPQGTYVDLREPEMTPKTAHSSTPPREPRSKPKSEPRFKPGSASTLRCTIGDLSAGLNLVAEERQFWQWLSLQLQTTLEQHPSSHAIRIKGYHLRHICLEPDRYWGTIMLAVEFDRCHAHDPGFVAGLDITRYGRRVKVQHVRTTFELPRYQALPRIVELIITELGL